MTLSMQFAGLLFACPVNVNGEECCFNELRRLPKAEAIQKWANLCLIEQKSMIDKHCICFNIQCCDS